MFKCTVHAKNLNRITKLMKMEYVTSKVTYGIQKKKKTNRKLKYRVLNNVIINPNISFMKIN